MSRYNKPLAILAAFSSIFAASACLSTLGGPYGGAAASEYERGYRDAGASNELFPHVIMIDGGMGQLNAAMDIFRTMNVKPPMVVSLAKQEELIHIHGRPEPLRLPRNHLGLKLLQYVRDEAHRFAQHYHHILRRKSQLEEDVRKGRRPPKKKSKPPDLQSDNNLAKGDV